MVNDLSVAAKETFQVVAVLATMLVVGIHYKSNTPDVADARFADANELAQEFIFGGLARVAVPLFAFAAGFFYFRSDDGSIATYRKKLVVRVRTVLVPYFLFGSIAMAFWLVVRQAEGKPIDLTPVGFLSQWFLRPPAEQLWFLRDLMVLVTIAPIIRTCGQTSVMRAATIGILSALWVANIQLFPLVAGWRVLQLETLLFFTLGFVAVSNVDRIEQLVHAPTYLILVGWAVWCALVAARIWVRADFDIWYVANAALPDLLLHQASVLFGTLTLFATAARLRFGLILRLSGGSFFVYLAHEFPLRAMLHRACDPVIDHAYSCWILTPMVLVGGYLAAILLSRYAPGLMTVLTGGRLATPARTNAARTHALSS